MTQYGKRWAKYAWLRTPRDNGLEGSYVEQGEFWIRAFCDEVEKRAELLYQGRVGMDYENAYIETRRELLGEPNANR